MTNYKELAKALRVLDEAPKKIAQAKEKYAQTLQDIKADEAKGIYSPNFIKKKRETAKQERDRVVKTLADSMVTAYGTVKENNNYDGEDIDLSDPKLTNAFNIINSMGKNVPHSTQVSILNQFKGNIPALKVLEGAFKKNGLYFDKLAHEMQQPISSTALNEMEIDLATYLYNAEKGIYDFENKRSYWSRNVYRDQATRLGMNLGDEPDPYTFALLEMKRINDADKLKPTEKPEEKAVVKAQGYALEKAIQDISDANAVGVDGASVFDNALQRMERLSGT